MEVRIPSLHFHKHATYFSQSQHTTVIFWYSDTLNFNSLHYDSLKDNI